MSCRAGVLTYVDISFNPLIFSGSLSQSVIFRKIYDSNTYLDLATSMALRCEVRGTESGGDESGQRKRGGEG